MKSIGVVATTERIAKSVLKGRLDEGECNEIACGVSLVWLVVLGLELGTRHTWKRGNGASSTVFC